MRVNSIPLEAQPYALVTAIVAVIFLGALFRLWFLRRSEARLLKNREALEKQILLQQRELMANRQDSTEWRAEIQRQFDIFRAMASEQLGLGEKRYNDMLKNSQQLQASLDAARQMCAELPAAKARVMQLEQALEIDGGEGFSAAGLEPAKPAAMAPLPVLAESKGPAKPVRPPVPGLGMSLPKPSAPPMPMAAPMAAAVAPSPAPADAGKIADLESKLASALQRNTTLQQALTAARLRNRVKNSTKPTTRPKLFR